MVIHNIRNIMYVTILYSFLHPAIKIKLQELSLERFSAYCIHQIIMIIIVMIQKLPCTLYFNINKCVWNSHPMSSVNHSPISTTARSFLTYCHNIIKKKIVCVLCCVCVASQLSGWHYSTKDWIQANGFCLLVVFLACQKCSKMRKAINCVCSSAHGILTFTHTHTPKKKKKVLSNNRSGSCKNDNVLIIFRF